MSERITEILEEHKKNKTRQNPEVAAFLENPVGYLSRAYKNLTEDLDPQKIQYAKGSRDWIIAKTLENQARYLIETTSTSAPVGQDITFTTVSMPLVRRIFNKLLAMDLVSVQPISQPTAKIFYLDFLYGTGGTSIYDTRNTSYSNSSEGSESVKEIDLKLTSETVTATEKKLKSKWTIEVEQDLEAYHGLNAENELMTILQEQIVREVDGMIIEALLNGATGTGSGIGTGAGNVNWNVNGYLAGDTTTTALRDYRKTIYEAVIDASNMIFKKRYRYATWIIGHPDAVVRLEKLEDFKLAEGANDYEFTVGRHLVGTLANRFKVYKDPFFPVTNKLLLGYKGDNWADAVGFYAPYIPLYTTPKIIDPDNFTPRRGLMSRFAYGTLIKDGLATVTITQS